MELTIDQALKGKATQIKGKEFLTTEAYITPFLERMSKFTDDFRIQAIPADQISLTKEGEINMEDMVYNRMWIEATLPEELTYTGHKESINLLYALDTRKPVVKIFKSGIRSACLNLCVFSPSYLNISALEPEMPINYKCINSLIEQTSDVSAWLRKLDEIEVTYNQELINENLGLWVRNSLNKSYDNGFGKVKLAVSTAIDAYKNLYENEESPYFVAPGETTNLFNIYNSFTDLISNDGTKISPRSGDIVNKCEKILLLKEILELA